MKTIIDLMRIDIMGLKAKKSGGMKAAIAIWTIIVLACVALALAGMSFILVCPMAFCLIMTVNIIVQNEIKQEYGITFCVVPADRKSVVIARFTLVAVICTVIGALFFAIMKITARLDLFSDSDEDVVFPPLLGNILFGVCFMISCIISSRKLKKLFRYGYTKKHTNPVVSVLTSIGAVVLMELGALGIMFAGSIPVVRVIAAMITPLAAPLDGMLLTGLLIIFGYAMMIYQAVCSVIYYDKREL